MSTPPFHPFRSEQAKADFEVLYLEKAKAWPVPSETRLVDTPSGRTFVRVSGCIGDPPLVLLAGARGTSLMWVPNIAALSARHRTYALDTVTDIGLSVARAEITKPEHLVEWLDEVLPALVPEGPFDLMGMSYGGWLAGQYALHRPARVRKVVLLAPAATALRSSFAFLLRIALIAMPFPGRHGGPVQRTLRWLFEDLVRSERAGRKPGGRGIDDVIEMVTMDRFFALPWMIWPTVLGDEAWRRFRVPALFVVGENEKIYSAKAAVRRLNRVAPQVMTEIIPGAGHDLTLVQADLVMEKVLEFLEEPLAKAADLPAAKR
jgi:pimeloyl-ACP methyl ester carboxylesterase